MMTVIIPTDFDADEHNASESWDENRYLNRAEGMEKKKQANSKCVNFKQALRPMGGHERHLWSDGEAEEGDGDE